MEVDSAKPLISFDRSICNDLQAAQQREWLVTNGTGSYGMGTVSGILTRGYHGLLIAALDPPLGRTLLVTNFEETILYGATSFELFSNSWNPGSVTPEGYQNIEAFHLEGTTPTWTFAIGDARLEKRVWMQPDENTTYVRYTLVSASQPLQLRIKALASYRDYHARTRDTSIQMQVKTIEHGLEVTPADTSMPFFILSNTAAVAAEHTWHENLYLSAEAERGLDPYDNELLVGTFTAALEVGESLNMIATTNSAAELDGQKAYQVRTNYERKLVEGSPLSDAPAEIRQLVLSADQFIVTRATGTDPDGHSIIAGYPWFSDWGRDTMISLPGLTLETGRFETAAKILQTFARFVDQGMLPNRFPDTAETPEYNTTDATLWYFQAIHAYYEATRDDDLLRKLFPVLEDIIAWHNKGTRHQIHVDPVDHLLYAGEGGVQLTWMDAKYGDTVVTPRIGKPVEINALWFNALHLMADFSHTLGYLDKVGVYRKCVDEVESSFERFWNQDTGYCYDVIDGPEGHESLLRPNQLLAISLPYSPLTSTQQKAVVDVCSQSLLTPYGLRSLAPDQTGYIGNYEGNTESRDSAYHQGTAWGWLIGPFIGAHMRVYGDSARAKALLDPLLGQHLYDYGLGSVSEIFDGDMPYTARGCPQQAWSVAELIRIWHLIQKS